MHTVGKKDPQRRQIEKLIATLHANLQQRWSVADMAATIPCSEAWLRRLFYAIPARRRKNITSMRVWIWRYRY